MSKNTSHKTREATTPDARKFLKARPLAERLGIHPKTLFRWAEQGLVAKFKIGPRAVLFDVAEVDRMVESARIGSPRVGL